MSCLCGVVVGSAFILPLVGVVGLLSFCLRSVTISRHCAVVVLFPCLQLSFILMSRFSLFVNDFGSVFCSYFCRLVG